MKRDYIEFNDRSVPLAYLITFRCYGTWLHGDERGSVGRRKTNVYGSPRITPSETLRRIDADAATRPPFELRADDRLIVETAIREVCTVRSYALYALNVRTNHAHSVVSNAGKPERMMESFKAYSTRALRAAGRIGPDEKPWSRHGSTRYLWTERHVELAVDYVLNGQGGDVPLFD
jgi:REP element-mobilizing transposase RayT